MAKRALDIIVSAAALLLTAPLLLVIGLLVSLDSRGPLFFRHRRMGHGGVPFAMLKFRTMVVGAERMGARLTLKRDPRVTRIGQLLRWLKLDELPQLINVLIGDMSLIGPRPEDPYFRRFYGPPDLKVLSVRPGILGPGQIQGRDEQELFPDNVMDPEAFYVEHILPDKLAVDRRYVETATLWGDLRLLARGALAVVATSLKASFLRRNVKRASLLASDLGLIAVAYLTAFFVHFGFDIGWHAAEVLARTLGLLLIVRPLFLVYYGLYVRTPRFFSLPDAIALVKAVTLGSAAVVALTFLSGLQEHSRAVFIEEWSLTLVLLGGLRLGLRNRARGAHRGSRRRALIAGAGEEAALLAQGLLRGSSVEPVALIDENARRWGSMIHGLTVLGGEGQIGPARATHGVETVLIAASDTRPEWQQGVLAECARLGIECRMIPAFRDLLTRSVVEVPSRTEAVHAGHAIVAVPEG